MVWFVWPACSSPLFSFAFCLSGNSFAFVICMNNNICTSFSKFGFIHLHDETRPSCCFDTVAAVDSISMGFASDLDLCHLLFTKHISCTESSS